MAGLLAVLSSSAQGGAEGGQNRSRSPEQVTGKESLPGNSQPLSLPLCLSLCLCLCLSLSISLHLLAHPASVLATVTHEKTLKQALL